MTTLPTDALDSATHRLLGDVSILKDARDQADTAAEPFEEIQNLFLVRLEKHARVLSVVLKANTDLRTFNKILAKQMNEKTYIRLDDLPPLCPEDVIRLRQEYYALAERVSLAREGEPLLAVAAGTQEESL